MSDRYNDFEDYGNESYGNESYGNEGYGFEDENDFDTGEMWRSKPSDLDELKDKITRVLSSSTSVQRYKYVDPDLSSQIDSFLRVQDKKRAYVVLESQIGQVQLTDFLRVDATKQKNMSAKEMMEARSKNPNFNKVPALNIVTIGVNPHLQKLGIVKALIDYLKYKAQEGGWAIMIIESVLNEHLYRYLKTKRSDCEEESSSRSFIFRLR